MLAALSWYDQLGYRKVRSPPVLGRSDWVRCLHSVKYCVTIYVLVLRGILGKDTGEIKTSDLKLGLHDGMKIMVLRDGPAYSVKILKFPGILGYFVYFLVFIFSTFNRPWQFRVDGKCIRDEGWINSRMLLFCLLG